MILPTAQSPARFAAESLGMLPFPALAGGPKMREAVADRCYVCGDVMDLDTHEPMLVDAIRSPQEVHRNSNDPQMAIIYQRLPGDDEHFLRVALWISDDDTGGRKNSVHSMRIARRKEVLDGRDAGRKVWP